MKHLPRLVGLTENQDRSRMFQGFLKKASVRSLRILFVSAATLLAGCGNDPNPTPLREKRADGLPWVVRYGAMSENPRSLDPQVTYDQMSRRVLEPVHDCLLEYHPMKTDPYEVVPALLAALPEHTANADGTHVYVCRLKPGVLFHDDPCFPGGKGREVVAGDVHFAFQRLCDPAVGSPIFGNLAEYIPGLTEAHGAAKKTGKFDYTGSLRGVELVDAHTFKIHLTRAYPQIVYWMAMHFTCPVAREAVEYYDGQEHPDGPDGRVVRRPHFAWHPVGTGPFKMVEYVAGQRVRLIRNEHYIATTFPTGGWPAEREALCRPLAGQPLPLVDEVQMTIFREAIPVFLLARQGYLDGMGVGKDAFNSVITPARELSPKYRARGLTLEKDIQPTTFYLSFNLEDPVIGPNKKLRQALNAAFDRQSYVDIFYNGVPTVAEQLIPPGIYGFQKGYRHPYAYDLEKARRLLAEAGYPDGRDAQGRQLELTLDTTATGPEERQQAEYEQRLFEQLGIRVRVLENTFARMLEKEDQGNFQIASGTGWGADYPDPENFFFLFYSKNFPPVGKNISRYKSAEFDRAFETMATMDNGPERLALVHKMTDLLADDCPINLTFNRAQYSVVQPFAPRTQNNEMLEGGLKYAVVDPVLRAQKQREWNPVPLWPAALALGLVVAGVGYGIVWNRQHDV